MEANNFFGRDRFGISLDYPSVTRPELCRYDACVASKAGEVLAGDAQHKVIPGGKYAAMRFEGTGAQIGEGLGSSAARVAAEERLATRFAAVLRVLPRGRALSMQKQRRVQLRHLRARSCSLGLPPTQENAAEAAAYIEC